MARLSRGMRGAVLRMRGAVLCLLLCLVGLRPSVAVANGPRVLVLNSYHRQYEWTERIVQGVLETLGPYVPPEQIYIEYMDARRVIDDPEHEALLEALYAWRYRTSPPDVIISSDDAALNFLTRRRDHLFPGVPVVFCGVNLNDPAQIHLDHATGILEGLAVRENVELIEALHPDLSRLVLLSDRSSFGRSMTQTARTYLASREDLAVPVEILDDITFDELEARLRDPEEGTVFLLLAIHEMKGGHYFAYETDLPQLLEHAGAPVYAMWGMLLGLGVVGGSMNDPEHHGRRAAKLALRVLAGEDPSTIPVSRGEYRPRFDYSVLEKHDIDSDRLPPASEVIGRPESFYAKHRTLVWAVAGIGVLLLFLVVGLSLLVLRMRRAERAQREGEAKLRLAQRLEAIGQLAGGVAHDFSNVLVPILLEAELLSYQLPKGSPALGSLERIIDAAVRARNIARQLLALGCQQALVMDAVDLNEVLHQLLPLLERSLPESIGLELVLSPSLPRLWGDPSQLDQVILNLVVNARDAIGRSGTIRVCTEVMQGKEGGRVSSQQVALVVADDGVGMSPEVQARIFDPFFTTKSEGTGIGLATLAAIVERHHGTIDVSSELGAGSRFTLCFPVTDRASRAQSAEDEIPSIGGCTVLVVEDDPAIRESVRAALCAHGAKVLVASDGTMAAALAKAEPDKIDLLLTDVVLPGLGGREIFEQLAALRPDLRVLYMSGYEAGQLAQHGVVPKEISFLRKPFSLHALLLSVGRAL